MTQGVEEGGGVRFSGVRAGPLIGFACALLMVGYIVLLANAAVRGTWLIGPHGAPAPGDFNGLWAAARLSFEGRAAQAYDAAALGRVLAGAGRPPRIDQQFPFFYPPVFLLWLKPLGSLAYPAAAATWIAATGAAYLVAVRMVSRRLLPLLVAVSAPAVLACVYVGQNGLLTAALAGTALVILPSRPLWAGVLIGMIAYKPQFGIALPILLVAGGRWRTVLAATVTAVATYAVAGVVLGWDAYARFLEQLVPNAGALPAIGTLPAAKLQSVYGLARTIGLASPLAWVVQISIALASLVSSVRLWRARSPWPLHAAAAAATMLIVSPYSLLYDYPLLSIALIFLLRDGERAPIETGQGAALILAFCAPFAGAAFGLPLCPLGAGLALAVAVARARSAITKVSPDAPHPNGAALAS